MPGTITGEGQRVDVSLMDSVIAATENTALKYLESGQIPPRMGNRYAAVSPYDGFHCKDGIVIIACGNQKLYDKLCNEILNRPDMITDPRFVDMPGRLKDQDDIQVVVEDWLKDKTMAEATDILLLPTAFPPVLSWISVRFWPIPTSRSGKCSWRWIIPHWDTSPLMDAPSS